MAALTVLDWVTLILMSVVYFYPMGISERFIDTINQRNYKGWKRRVRSFLAFPGWGWQTLLFVAQGLLVAASFLYLRNYYAGDPRPIRYAIVAVQFCNTFFLKLWTAFLLWGPEYWWLAFLDSLAILGTGVAELILMGLYNDWLPFGLYGFYVLLAFIVSVATLVFWINAFNVEILQKRRRGARREGKLPKRRLRGIVPPEFDPTVDYDEDLDYYEDEYAEAATQYPRARGAAMRRGPTPHRR